MTSSEASKREAGAVVGQIMRLMDGAYLARFFDEPVDRAAAQYGVPHDWAYSHESFQLNIARFVQHVYASALLCPEHLTLSEARDEAVSLLADAPLHAERDVYCAALIQVESEGAEGLVAVLLALAQAVKAQRRSQHEREVRLHLVETADWRTRRAIAELLITKWPQWPPAGWDACSLDELARGLWTFLTMTLQVCETIHSAADDVAVQP